MGFSIDFGSIMEAFWFRIPWIFEIVCSCFFASYFYVFLIKLTLESLGKIQVVWCFFDSLARYRFVMPFWWFGHRYWLHFGSRWEPSFIICCLFSKTCFMYMFFILAHFRTIFACKLVHSGYVFVSFLRNESLRSFAGSLCDATDHFWCFVLNFIFARPPATLNRLISSIQMLHCSNTRWEKRLERPWQKWVG